MVSSKLQGNHYLASDVYHCILIQVDSDSFEDIEKSVKYTDPVAKTDTHHNNRQVSVRMSVPPGKYAIIPSTFKAGDEGKFLVRLFLTRGWGSSRQSECQAVTPTMDYK